MPLSHNLPLYFSSFPLYDRLPERIGKYIGQKRGPLTCVDVGANIGDTIAAFRQNNDDHFLAIEPNPHFAKYLRHNWKDDATVHVLQVICSSDNESGMFKISESGGTASIVAVEEGNEIESKSLDHITERLGPFAEPHIIKIDTDGYDFEVISGACGVLERTMPALLFECASFSNRNYLADCLRSLQLLNGCGYNHFLVYDNFGNLFGGYQFADLQAFKNLLFYQMTAGSCYFDILVMRDEDLFEFHALEVDFMTQRMKNPALITSAVEASGIVRNLI